MSVALLKSRLAKLEATKRTATKAIGILNYCDSQDWPAWDGKGPFIGVIGGTRISREEWPERCRKQQAELQEQLRGFAAQLTDDAPQPDAPRVGTVKDQIAPWPKDRKRPKFVEVAGKEIEIATFKGFAR